MNLRRNINLSLFSLFFLFGINSVFGMQQNPSPLTAGSTSEQLSKNQNKLSVVFKDISEVLYDAHFIPPFERDLYIRLRGKIKKYENSPEELIEKFTAGIDSALKNIALAGALECLKVLISALKEASHAIDNNKAFSGVGRQFIYFVVERGHDECAMLLLNILNEEVFGNNKQGLIDSITPIFDSPFILAVRKGKFKFVELFINILKEAYVATNNIQGFIDFLGNPINVNLDNVNPDIAELIQQALDQAGRELPEEAAQAAQ